MQDILYSCNSIQYEIQNFERIDSMKVILSLLALMFMTALSAAVPFTRTSDFTPVTIGERARNAKETMYFAEAQLKYGMFQNYLHYWIDRPLFWNRATRHPNASSPI